MTLISNALGQSASSKEQENSSGGSRSDIRQLFEKVMKEKGAYHPDRFQWLDDETVEVTFMPGLPVHNFVLEAEALGKKVTYEKKTIVKITDK